MSTYLGKQLLSGVGTNTIANAHSLFDFKWTDHILNEMSWLRSDTYSWHNGDVYVAAYNHLENDLENYVSAETDIIDGIEIWYVVSPDGHKIIDAGYPDQEHRTLAAEQLFNKTGISWYYIIDRVNKRFKLPRTKFGFVGFRDNVGNYVPESLPNLRGMGGFGNDDIYVDGVLFTKTSNSYLGSGAATDNNNKIPVFNAHSYCPTYQDGAPVQTPATQMYLYFYVGDYDVSDIKGINLENRNAITNCITEIPQDIKLELNDGTLTLKAGSKVYVPNGFEQDGTTPKFDEVILENDISNSDFLGNTVQVLLYVRNGGQYFDWRTSRSSHSGSSDPQTTGTHYYDTSTNILTCWFQAGGSARDSLPIALITLDNGVCTSIDQVFNGFCYIGSTVFALPGVKGLIPNGRNADGTLKNTEVTIPSVKTITFSSAFNDGYVLLSSDSSLIGGNKPFYYNKDVNSLVAQEATYIEAENKLYRYGVTLDTIYEPHAVLICIFGVDSNTQITNFNPKTTFHALDYNDLDYELNQMDSTLVHKTGDEMVGGNKTFSGTNTFSGGNTTFVYPITAQSVINRKNISLATNGTTPSAETSTPIHFMANDDSIFGYIRCRQRTDGTYTAELVCRRTVSGTQTDAGLQIYIDSSGNSYATAPTPALTDNNTKIATTEYCNKAMCGAIKATSLSEAASKTNSSTSWQGSYSWTATVNCWVHLRLSGTTVSSNGMSAGYITVNGCEMARNSCHTGREYSVGPVYVVKGQVVTYGFVESTSAKLNYAEAY